MIWLIAALVGVGFLFKDTAEAALEGSSVFSKYDALYKEAGRKYSVPWRWIKAIAIVESNQGQAASVARGLLNPTDIDGSKSSDGKSWGIMQTTLPTARDMGGIAIEVPYLNDARASIFLGTKYLAWIIGKKGLNFEKVSRSYNGGPGYMTTGAGPALTLLYYGKAKAALELVLSRQPGNELEFS